MRWRWSHRGLVSALALGVLAGTTALGQQKYRLRDTYAPGDLCVVDSSMDMSMHVTITARGQVLDPVPVVTRKRESLREEVLSVDAKGPTGLRRTYSVSRTLTVDPSLQEKKSPSPLQGKTITIQRKGGKVVVTATPGKLPPREQQALAKALTTSDMAFFPDREVAVGDEWPIEPELLARLFPGMDRIEAKYQFQEVVDHAGHPCARIHLTLDGAGDPRQSGEPTTIKLTGNLYHALDLKRTLGYELTGPTTTEAVREQDGTTLTMKGEGTMRLKETRRWLHVHGRPVVAKRAGAAAP